MRAMGIIRDPDFPPSLEEWANEGVALSPSEWIGKVAPRPHLLLHGDADDVVSPDSVYTLFERAGEGKEMRMLPGVGHRFRSEATAIGVALEWLKGRVKWGDAALLLVVLARRANAWAVLGRRVHCSRVSRSAPSKAEGGIGLPLPIFILPLAK